MLIYVMYKGRKIRRVMQKKLFVHIAFAMLSIVNVWLYANNGARKVAHSVG